MNKFMTTGELELTDEQLELVNGAAGNTTSIDNNQVGINTASNEIEVGGNAAAAFHSTAQANTTATVNANQSATATQKQWYFWS